MSLVLRSNKASGHENERNQQIGLAKQSKDDARIDRTGGLRYAAASNGKILIVFGIRHHIGGLKSAPRGYRSMRNEVSRAYH